MIVDDLIALSIGKGASDIHIEPNHDEIVIRLRIDGILKKLESLPMNLLDRIMARIKVLANLNISETRHPQDGRFEVRQEKNMEMRVSTFPTLYGECAVIRILDQSKLISSFEELGIDGELKNIFNDLIKKPYGFILLTGPTGSGKTTTLFSMLNKINSTERCITTLEDPVEIRLPLLRQTQIQPEIGFGFPEGLRSLFRQNPDVIMVGEIRDKETADIAIQAAITGHLVISTLHTNDSIGALIRLREMELEKFMITSAISGIIAQRLVRKICPKCRVPHKPSPELISMLGLENEDIQYFRGTGCDVCQNTGYSGRIGIFEVLIPNEEINTLIYKDADWQDMFNASFGRGLPTLRQNGLEKVRQGITTLEEILRVTE